MIHQPSYTATFSRAAVRSLDRAAFEEYAIPGIVLMENAAAAIEETALAMLAPLEHDPSGRRPLTCIICGPGNNGGDGLALARRLTNRGERVIIVLAADRERFSGDALTNLTIARRMAIPFHDIDLHQPGASLMAVLTAHGRLGLIVDALLGTGLDRALSPPLSDVVRWINTLRTEGAQVLAVDIPTGLDADTGVPLGSDVVRADRTVTLAGRKRGFDLPASRDFTGDVTVGDIGVPTELLRRFDGR